MSMRAKFANAAEKIFTKFGDVPESVTYRSIGDQAWNDVDGEIQQAVTEVSLSMVVGKLNTERLATQASRMDRVDLPNLYHQGIEGMIRAAELVDGTGAPIEPKLGDQVVRTSGTYTVKDWYTDPANVLWNVVLAK